MDSGLIDISNIKKQSSIEKDKLLLKAVKYGLIEPVAHLIEAGANIELLDDTGDTMLMSASLLKHEKIVYLFIKAGANVDAQDDLFGNTALMLSIMNGDIHISYLLIAADTDVSIRNALEQTAFHSAFNKKHTELMYLLFSVMSQEQLNREIQLQPQVEEEYQNFTQAVAKHRLEGFKTLGPLLLDKNESNPFNFLPFDVQQFILFRYCQLGTTEQKWRIQHAHQDTLKICDALYPKAPLIFSNSSPHKKKNKTLTHIIDNTLCSLMKNLRLKPKK